METPDDKNLYRRSIEYLHEISCLPDIINVPALNTIYNTKCRLMELRQAITLPSYLTKSSVKCQRCLINYREGPARYVLRKAQKQNRFAKRMLEKKQAGQSLTSYQRQYIKKIKNSGGNTVVIICKFCKYENFIHLDKPKKVQLSGQQTVLKKKRKRKDKYSGLNKDVVEQIHNKSKRDSESVICLDSTLSNSLNNDDSVIVLNTSVSTLGNRAKTVQCQKTNMPTKSKRSVQTKQYITKSPVTPSPKQRSNLGGPKQTDTSTKMKNVRYVTTVNETSLLSKESPKKGVIKFKRKGAKENAKKNIVLDRNKARKKKKLSILSQMLQDDQWKKKESSKLKLFLTSL